jgi:hypothetical protein
MIFCLSSCSALDPTAPSEGNFKKAIDEYLAHDDTAGKALGTTGWRASYWKVRDFFVHPLSTDVTRSISGLNWSVSGRTVPVYNSAIKAGTAFTQKI